MLIMIGCGKCGKVLRLKFGYFILHIQGLFIHQIIHEKTSPSHRRYLL